MPLVTVSMYPGRTQEQKNEFAKAITKSAVEILKTKEQHVIVIFEDNRQKDRHTDRRQTDINPD